MTDLEAGECDERSEAEQEEARREWLRYYKATGEYEEALQLVVTDAEWAEVIELRRKSSINAAQSTSSSNSGARAAMGRRSQKQYLELV
mmetsp:Transcript_41346/g.68777  ORF Transcript_41346/g.68777 Transcript_41346/m.68777 type:complete len:89 (+) Transcript_41346:75-341(+)|eukprot:CAMPEP_0119317882 /NCGR_PEP_ID=MMETSP1333-20130426/44721_1 /TAXON_ID=418940 /ORGANISM="Scyphosphaera apsteinii, Strain RCC1455" /LENGTH=88 /DNA_ID=CAMNT_0007323951 /DNA_START=135 /DNA_END=401 /DNA_ORIENTATION=-